MAILATLKLLSLEIVDCTNITVTLHSPAETICTGFKSLGHYFLHIFLDVVILA
jgi:hypothetical protein